MVMRNADGSFKQRDPQFVVPRCPIKNYPERNGQEAHSVITVPIHIGPFSLTVLVNVPQYEDDQYVRAYVKCSLNRKFVESAAAKMLGLRSNDSEDASGFSSDDDTVADVSVG